MNTTFGAIYEVTFAGTVVPEDVIAAFEGMSIERTATGVSVCGPLPDQAALHGVLSRGRQIGLDLVEMHRLQPEVERLRQEPTELLGLRNHDS